MMKRITERKWNKLYKQATDGFYEKENPDGSRVYTIEGFKKYMNAVKEFPDYKIIGIRHQLNVLKDKWHDYKLRHLRLGKVKMHSKDNNVDFEIEKIDWNVHWQTKLYLAVIIRDYLRFFINNTMVVGNCVIDKNKRSGYERNDDDCNDDDWNEWRDLVNTVADEFDEWLKLYTEIETGEDFDGILLKRKQLLQKAFSDLAYIYEDLWW